MMPFCPRCGHIHSPADVLAADRFDPSVTTTYRSVRPDAPAFPTRNQAEADLCDWRQKEAS